MLHVLVVSFAMFWDVFWPLVLGFILSGIVQALVSHKALVKTLGGNSVKNFFFATLFGIASSSCSFAAIALARSLFKKGASLASALIFEIASTNLVIELGVILFVLLGWQFALAQWLGGICMIILLAVMLRLTLTKKIVNEARRHAMKGRMGKMEGHAAMDMSITKSGSFFSKLVSPQGFTALSHFFVMDITAIWLDLLIGFLIAGALAVWVPQTFWQTFFLSNNPSLSTLEGPLIGPLIAILSFVCSIGNVPLAAVLWSGGMSFGGVISFIFADLIILPILDVYRKYYGWKVTIYIFTVFYITMALAGYLVELIFQALHMIPQRSHIGMLTTNFSYNVTTFLNLFFLLISIFLVWRFLRTGGGSMLKTMNMTEEKMEHCH